VFRVTTNDLHTGTTPTAPQLRTAMQASWSTLCVVRASAVRADRKIATEAGTP
jgi:hypothetical protein